MSYGIWGRTLKHFQYIFRKSLTLFWVRKFAVQGSCDLFPLSLNLRGDWYLYGSFKHHHGYLVINWEPVYQWSASLPIRGKFCLLGFNQNWMLKSGFAFKHTGN